MSTVEPAAGVSRAEYFRTLFASWAPIASAPVLADATLVLGL